MLISVSMITIGSVFCWNEQSSVVWSICSIVFLGWILTSIRSQTQSEATVKVCLWTKLKSESKQQVTRSPSVILRWIRHACSVTHLRLDRLECDRNVTWTLLSPAERQRRHRLRFNLPEEECFRFSSCFQVRGHRVTVCINRHAK